ncbi:Mitotic spindle checkpoint component mad2 [Tulasnella sp. UAMH 9824]|nr:Mitotic spindle checkpoint component mad2 [Tulasnella sp. UAMH 9824]
MPPPSQPVIALRGSATAIADYLRYAIYSILFLRGVYAIEDFMVVNKFDLELLIATNEELETYVSSVLSQVEQWLMTQTINQVVLVIVSKETKKTLERWVFDVKALEPPPGAPPKPDSEVQAEVRSMLAGIRGTNSMLSDIQEPALCNILAYIKDDGQDAAADGWEDTHTHAIEMDSATEVKLKKASTSVHQIQATVVYRDD